MATVRREVRIGRDADAVWERIGDPARITEWFPGMVGAVVDGTSRVITTATGFNLPEEIVTNDPIQRRFQYRLVAPFITSHLGTVDVFDLGDGTSLAVYSTDCVPDAMALIIGGATGAALAELRRQVESTPVVAPREP
jgi:hypothetical protein